MKLFVFIFLLFIQIKGISQGLQGTALSYSISDKEAIIAADTKINFSEPHKDSSHVKILHNNNLSWVCIGLANIGKQFDAHKIINLVASKKRGYRNTRDEIDIRISNMLAKCDYLLYDNPVRDMVLKREGLILKVLFVSFENKKIQYEFIEYVWEKKGREEQVAAYIREDQNALNNSPNRTIIRGVGIYQPDSMKFQNRVSSLINKKAKSTKFPTVKIPGFTTFKVDSYAKLLYYLVYRTSLKHPTKVSRPITVYKITDNHFQQVINK